MLSDAVTVELIADLVHLHPATLQLTYRLKGRDKIVLVTDAIRAKCLGDGVFDLGGPAIEVHQQVARLNEKTLAGSVLTLCAAAKNMRTSTDCSLEDLIHFTAVNPAKSLHVFDRKGSIAIGKEADLIVVDDALNVKLTLCRGVIAYKNY